MATITTAQVTAIAQILEILIPLGISATQGAVTVELGLGAIQDGIRAICDPTIAFPTPIKECTATSISIGLTTAKFQTASATLAKGFTFQVQLADVLNVWKVGDPIPTQLPDLLLLIQRVSADLQGVIHNATTDKIFTGLDTLLTALQSILKAMESKEPLPLDAVALVQGSL